MKKQHLIPSLLFSIFSATAFAQDGNLNKDRLSYNLYEQYTVSTTNNKQKDGLYLVYNDDNKLILRGAYKAGKQTGKWRFFDPEQHLTQVFDYNDGKLYFSNADSLSYVTTESFITNDLTADVKAPVKIGGSTFTFLLLFSPKSIPANIIKAKQDIKVTYTFNVSETGKAEDVTATYAVDNNEEKRRISIKTPELLEFLPAMLNGKPVKSKVTFTSTIYMDKLRVLGNNNIVSQ